MTIFIANRRKIVLHPNYILVCRPSVLGNPFKMKCAEDRNKVIKEYEEWINNILFSKQLLRFHTETQQPMFQELDRIYKQLVQNETVTLVCWCSPLPCHAEIIGKIIEKINSVTINIQYI